MEKLSGKVAIVTGASKGMGRHFVTALVEQGMKVAALARASAELDSLAAELGGNGIVIRCDVTQSDQVNAAIAQTVDHFGQLDVLVNNAAIYSPFPFDEGSDAIIRQHLEVNVLGPAWTMRAAIPHLRQTQGQIVNVSSESVRMPFPMLALYGGTKAALEVLTQGLRDELRSDGIRLSVLRSGSIAGGSGGDSWSDENRQKFLTKIVQTGHAAFSGESVRPETMSEALVAMLALPRDVSVDLIELRGAHAGMPEAAKGAHS